MSTPPRDSLDPHSIEGIVYIIELDLRESEEYDRS